MAGKKAHLPVGEGKLVIISGASAGVGKNTILKIFLQRHPDWQNPPSTVTRPPRAGEAEGVDYFFVDKATFKQKAAAGDFLETDFHADHWYGTLKGPIEQALKVAKNVIIIKDVNGAAAIKRKIPEAIVIFIDVESPEILESRIRARQTETEEQIQRRLKLAKKEQEFKKQFDHVVVNSHNKAEEAVKSIERIVGA